MVTIRERFLNANDLKILRFQKLFEAHKINQDPKIFGDYYIKISQSTQYPMLNKLCQLIHANDLEIGIITNGFTDTQYPMTTKNLN